MYYAYSAAWNEAADPASRDSLLDQWWAQDGVFTDDDNPGRARRAGGAQRVHRPHPPLGRLPRFRGRSRLLPSSLEGPTGAVPVCTSRVLDLVRFRLNVQDVSEKVDAGCRRPVVLRLATEAETLIQPLRGRHRRPGIESYPATL
jgi:hypothetical protein